MNIFNALSQGDGSITETNVTSFLSYTFNETNEFSATLLLLFLAEIEIQVEGLSFDEILSISGNNFRQRVHNFRNNHTYSSFPEHRLTANGTVRDADILVTISESNGDNDCCYLLIENKIKKSALKEEQCTEQFLLFNQMEDCQENVPIFSILISPDIDDFSKMLDNVKSKNNLSAWIKWHSENETSMVDIFKTLIELENKSNISPIDQNVLYIIKSFIDYIATNLSKTEKLSSFSIAGSEVVEAAPVELDGMNFTLNRYDNNAIRLFDSENEIVDKQIKPILRELIAKYKLGIVLERKPGKMKNTRRLGREVIRELKSQRDG